MEQRKIQLLFNNNNKDFVKGPIKEGSLEFRWFFVGFIVVGAFFLLNLFVGVISLNYSRAEKKVKNKYLTKDQ